mmetsp:Transcript_37506/g.87309  ORF Transcript_37506/g.87309 Transcript_37506/m.87309 type:complete len:318 (+) Transcript_37506:4562-5515(+)
MAVHDRADHRRVARGAPPHCHRRLATRQLDQGTRRVDAELLDQQGREGMACGAGVERLGGLRRRHALAATAARQLGEEDIGQPQQLGRFAGLGQTLRIASATGLLVMLGHGGQPFGISQAGVAQPGHGLIRVAVDGRTLRRQQLAAPRGQAPLQVDDGEVHRQRRADQAALALRRPGQAAREHGRDCRRVLQVCQAIALVAAVVVLHDDKQRLIGEALGPADQLRGSLLHARQEERLLRGSQQRGQPRLQRLPAGEEVLATGATVAATPRGIAQFVQIDEDATLEQGLARRVVRHHLALGQQQFAVGITHAEWQRRA